MIDKTFFDEVTQKFTDLLPDSLQHIKADMEKNTLAILQSAFAKLNLVTREEFDVQVNVLKKTRAKLEALEKIVAELQAKDGSKVSKKTAKE